MSDLLLEFHTAFGLPMRALPTLDIDCVTAELRLSLLCEESRELSDAVDRKDLVAIADALADIAYVVYGTAITYGIDLDSVIREVHRSNMSKLDGQGRPILRSDGKVVKSEMYSAPDVNTVLGLQLPLF